MYVMLVITDSKKKHTSSDIIYKLYLIKQNLNKNEKILTTTKKN